MRLVPDDTWAILTVWQEARGEPFDGKIAVARVIRNRMRLWHLDVVGTVLAPSQFSGWNTSDHNRLVAARLDDASVSAMECRNAWAVSESSDGGVDDAVFYFNPAGLFTTPTWARSDKFVAAIGAHRFYRQ